MDKTLAEKNREYLIKSCLILIKGKLSNLKVRNKEDLEQDCILAILENLEQSNDHLSYLTLNEYVDAIINPIIEEKVGRGR